MYDVLSMNAIYQEFLDFSFVPVACTAKGQRAAAAAPDMNPGSTSFCTIVD